DRNMESAQDYARLHGCLEGLASHERAALRGAFFDGSTYEDLASRMKVPLGTMKSWIRRAMIKLKACLEQGAIRATITRRTMTTCSPRSTHWACSPGRSVPPRSSASRASPPLPRLSRTGRNSL